MFVETKTDGEAQVQLEPWRQILARAADEMERRGHGKHALLGDNGAVCVLGAINMAAFGVETCSAVSAKHQNWITSLEAQERLETFLGIPSVVDWNNDPRRPGSEVVAAMRACAAA